jgi:hypothetical protein
MYLGPPEYGFRVRLEVAIRVSVFIVIEYDHLHPLDIDVYSAADTADGLAWLITTLIWLAHST